MFDTEQFAEHARFAAAAASCVNDIDRVDALRWNLVHHAG